MGDNAKQWELFSWLYAQVLMSTGHTSIQASDAFVSKPMNKIYRKAQKTQWKKIVE